MSTRHIIRNIVIGVLALTVALMTLCVVVLNTNAFRNFLRSEIIKVALQSEGARVEIAGIETNWRHLTLNLNGIVVRSNQTSAASQPPVLEAKQLAVGVQFTPLLHRKVELSTLILEQPVVRVSIDSQGQSNLPVAPPSTGPSENVFDLEIEDCAIHSGEIYYADREIPLDAQVHNVKFQAGYQWLAGAYKGSLSYDLGRITTEQLGPVPTALKLDFTATRSNFSIDHLVLASGDSRISLNATLTNYAEPTIEGNYETDLVTDELARILRLTVAPTGNVALAGEFTYRGAAQQSFLAGLYVRGETHSARLTLQTSQRPLNADSISASYELKDANLRVNNVEAGFLGGHIKANYELLHMDAAKMTSRLVASVRGVSLKTASDTLLPKDIHNVPLSGTTNLAAQVAWSGSIDSLIAHLRLAIVSPQKASSNQSTIPVNGLVLLDYDGPRNTLSVPESHIQTMSTTLSLGGTLQSTGTHKAQLTVSATTKDLQEVGTLLTMVENAMAPQKKSAPLPQLGGSASLNATITGSATDPQIISRLDAQNLTVDRSHWRSLSLVADANSSKVEIQHGMLLADPRGQISVSGMVGLKQWAPPEGAPIQLQASIANMPVASLADFAQLQYPVTGTLSANIAVKGTKDAPEANGTITVANGSAWNEPINNLTANVQSNEGTIRSTVSLKIPAGTVSADASYKIQTEQYELKLQGNGIQFDKIAMLQHAIAIQGAANLSATGSGTIHNPQLDASLTSSEVQVAGQRITGINAQVRLAHQHAALTFQSQYAQGAADAKADVDLTGRRYATASVDVRALPVAAILAEFMPEQKLDVSGQTELHLAVKGPLATPMQMEAHLEIPTLNVAYQDAQLALAQPLKADFHNGILTVQQTRIQGTGANLTFQGTLPLREKASKYSVSADGSLDLAVLQRFVPDVHSSGQVNLQLQGQGTFSDPGLRGQIRIVNATLSADEVPVGIESLNTQINLSGARADIANFSATVGGGKLTAAGFVSYGHETVFNLGVQAETVRIRYPQGLRSVLSGRINLRGTSADSALTGRVVVDRLSFTQGFDLATFANSFSNDSTNSTPSPFERHMKINVAVQSGQDINLASSKVSIGGTANLNIAGTLDNPVVLGRIGLTSGEVFFLGKRFEVQSGTIEFANPVETQPVLNVYVTTTVEQYNITLNLSGPVDRLKTNYTSDPSLAPADIIHLLAFGNTAEEAASEPSQSATMGAESVLAQGVSSQVAGKLESLTGISELSFDPLATNTQGDAGTQVAIQERVTGNLLFSFSTDVTTTQNQVIELQYNVTKETSITVLRDQNGGYGIDIRIHKTF